MTSIRETASETLHFAAGLGWANAGGPGAEITASTTPLAGIAWEPLLQLDAPGWAQVFADNEVDRDFTRKLDRLVATWLTQEDYRELREIASKKTSLPVSGAADAVFSDWIDDSACKRLSHLVTGMRFTEHQVPVCYALCNAERAVLSVVDYSRRPQGLSEQGKNCHQTTVCGLPASRQPMFQTASSSAPGVVSQPTALQARSRSRTDRIEYANPSLPHSTVGLKAIVPSGYSMMSAVGAPPVRNSTPPTPARCGRRDRSGHDCRSRRTGGRRHSRAGLRPSGWLPSALPFQNLARRTRRNVRR